MANTVFRTVEEVQARLNELGYDAGPPDGVFGGRTKKAVIAFQTLAGLVTDGDPGPKTQAAMFADNAPRGDANVPQRVISTPAPIGDPSRTWPTQAQCTSFYGPPAGPRATAGRCRLPFPFRYDWDRGTTFTSFSCHDLVAASFEGIFADAARHYGKSMMMDLGLDLFGGCYNPRRMRGGSSWSMHAWGIAVDLDPDENELHTPFAKAKFGRPEYGPWWDIVESYGAVSLGRTCNFDAQHFQFARIR